MCPDSGAAVFVFFTAQVAKALRGREAIDNRVRFTIQTLAQSVMAQLTVTVMSQVIRKQIRNPTEMTYILFLLLSFFKYKYNYIHS